MFGKTIIKRLILFLTVLLLPPSWVQAAEQKPAHVLLVYDSLAKGTSREGNVEALQRLLASFGTKVTLTTFDSYQKGALQAYTNIIGIGNAADLPINQDFIRDFQTFEGHYLHVGAHIPEKVKTKLNIQTRTEDKETVLLSIGQFSQSAIPVQNITRIIQASGTAYGRIASAGGDKESPYGVFDGRLAYVPYFEQGNLSELAMGYLIKDWLHADGQKHTYLVFKEVYPFSDLRMLEQLSDKLYEAGIPFILSIRPVFSNTDYPAMKRYLETLKYAQARNGSILVNAPVVASTISQNDQNLKAQMESFVDVLADNGIAPLGMGAEMYWSYDRKYTADAMGFFTSGILFPNEKLMYKSRSESSVPFPSSMYSLKMSFLQQLERSSKILQEFPMDLAITYDFFEDETQLNQAVQALADSWITFADYKYANHEVRTQANTISSRNGNLLINGQHVDLNNAVKSISSDYTYRQEKEKSFTGLFNVQNKIFIIVILVTLLAFGIFLIIGHRLYKRKYFK